MKLKATRDGDGWRLNGQKTWTTSAHFAEWYWVGARTDPESPSTTASRCSSCRSTTPASPSTAIWTMGDERTNDVFFDDVFVHDDYVVGELNHGFQYISEALDLERFTMFTFSPIKQRLDLLCDYVATETVDGEPLQDDPVIRKQIARLATEAEVARVLGLRFVAKSMKGGAPPTTEASEYKLYATELSKRLANASMDIGGPGSQLRVQDRGGADEGARRVDVPLHRHRHRRRRRLRDPEEHHLAAQARPPEELLSVVRVRMTEMLEGITVLDLATSGPPRARRAGSPTTARRS